MMMQMYQSTLESCGTATGMVVAIDVLRAFTTAAYAFAAGAREILLVGTVAEALALRAQVPDALVMGEVDGLPVQEFDLDNSPAALLGRDLYGRTLIQRTTAGTQGIVRSHAADALLAASFVCAGATARYVARSELSRVTFVVTGVVAGRDGDEDAACADYLMALLRGTTPDAAPFLQRVHASFSGRLFADPARPEFPAADLACCAEVDRFDFAMPVERRDGGFVMRPVRA